MRHQDGLCWHQLLEALLHVLQARGDLPEGASTGESVPNVLSVGRSRGARVCDGACGWACAARAGAPCSHSGARPETSLCNGRGGAAGCEAAAQYKGSASCAGGCAAAGRGGVAAQVDLAQLGFNTGWPARQMPQPGTQQQHARPSGSPWAAPVQHRVGLCCKFRCD